MDSKFRVQPNGQLFANIWDTSGNYHVFYSATGVLDPANFQHVALTYDKSSGNAFIYRNGVVVASANIGNITPQTSYAYPRIGLRSATSIGNSYYTGLIDELSLYSRALSPAEIEAIYNAGSAGKMPAGTGSSNKHLRACTDESCFVVAGWRYCLRHCGRNNGDAGRQSHLWQWQGGTGVRLGWQHQLYHGVGFA